MEQKIFTFAQKHWLVLLLALAAIFIVAGFFITGSIISALNPKNWLPSFPSVSGGFSKIGSWLKGLFSPATPNTTANATGGFTDTPYYNMLSVPGVGSDFGGVN